MIAAITAGGRVGGELALAIGTDVSELDVRHCATHHSAFDASFGSSYYR